MSDYDNAVYHICVSSDEESDDESEEAPAAPNSKSKNKTKKVHSLPYRSSMATDMMRHPTLDRAPNSYRRVYRNNIIIFVRHLVMFFH